MASIPVQRVRARNAATLRSSTGDSNSAMAAASAWAPPTCGRISMTRSGCAAVLMAPDLVIEIASAGTRRRDKGRKRAIYEREGVGEYWMVDPDAGQVTVLHRPAAPST